MTDTTDHQHILSNVSTITYFQKISNRTHNIKVQYPCYCILREIRIVNALLRSSLRLWCSSALTMLFCCEYCNIRDCIHLGTVFSKMETTCFMRGSISSSS